MNDQNHQCKDIMSSLSDYVDGTLQEALCVELERHLKECDNCRIVVDTLRKTIELYQDVETSSKELPDDVRKRLFRKLDLQEFTK